MGRLKNGAVSGVSLTRQPPFLGRTSSIVHIYKLTRQMFQEKAYGRRGSNCETTSLVSPMKVGLSYVILSAGKMEQMRKAGEAMFLYKVFPK